MTGSVLSLGTYTAQAAILPDGDAVELTVYVSTDPGPAHHFRPCLTVQMTEACGSELLGTLAIAMRDLRQRRAAATSIQIEGPSA